jgi:predicted RecA/RadA family phage recombinase
MLSPSIKHGTDNHEASRDGTFTYPKNETDNEETGKVLASRVAA